MPPTLPGVEPTPAAPAPPTDDPDRWDTFQIKGKDGRHSGWGFVDKRLRSFLAELGAHVKPKQAIAAITNGFEIHKDELAVLLGSNRRTIWRWETNQTHPSEFEALLLGALVRAAVDDRLAVARANVARLLRAYGGAYALTFALACVMPPPADMGRSPASWAM
jgi:DNA-binding XRE family transcriptional regulator